MLTRSHLGCKLALLGRANWAATVVAAVVGTALLLLVPTAATAADSSTSNQAAFLRTAHPVARHARGRHLRLRDWKSADSHSKRDVWALLLLRQRDPGQLLGSGSPSR